MQEGTPDVFATDSGHLVVGVKPLVEYLERSDDRFVRAAANLIRQMAEQSECLDLENAETDVEPEQRFSVTLDVVFGEDEDPNETPDAAAATTVAEFGLDGYEIVKETGPAGWPEVRFTGTAAAVRRVVTAWSGEQEGEVNFSDYGLPDEWNERS